MASVPSRDKRSPARAVPPPSRATLTLRDICTALVASGDILQTDAERVLSANLGSAGGDTAPRHPLELVAIAALTSQRSGQTLNLERLTQWLANWAGQDYYHIDPLKIDTVAIARVMSFAFAQRHGILAVEIHNDEVIIASAEPFRSEWEHNLRQAVHKDIKRVVINPDDLRRYTQEFYQLASSVDKAGGGQIRGAAAGHQNFEQLLDLGTNEKPEANDQHVVKIVAAQVARALGEQDADLVFIDLHQGHVERPPAHIEHQDATCNSLEMSVIQGGGGRLIEQPGHV